MGGVPAVLPPSGLLADKPLRFTDSPQHYAVGGGSGSNVPTPSPRRKNSVTSNSEEVYSPELARIERLPPAYVGSQTTFPDYGPPVYTMLTGGEYFRPVESGYLAPTDYQLVLISFD